jgi:hypothetical protein
MQFQAVQNREGRGMPVRLSDECRRVIAFADLWATVKPSDKLTILESARKYAEERDSNRVRYDDLSHALYCYRREKE